MSSLRNRQALLERELQRSQEALSKMKQEQFHSVLAHLPEAQRLAVRECIQMSKLCHAERTSLLLEFPDNVHAAAHPEPCVVLFSQGKQASATARRIHSP
ncbi:hypothetical protein HPB48_022890 [Haemaphysalis longicornis]|uniref:Uncharacterized protein n=1 Tax=Haemaphysalis longicornis TaxID=44386 RepID=A0A9J6H3I6_HAELO|nr:hypothetical protein HPB48_022890 [Haemaphysalis longicornis]